MLGQGLEEQQPPLQSLKLAACGAVPQSPTQQHHHLQAPHTCPDMSSMHLAVVRAFGTMSWLVLVHPHVCSSALFELGPRHTKLHHLCECKSPTFLSLLSTNEDSACDECAMVLDSLAKCHGVVQRKHWCT